MLKFLHIKLCVDLSWNMLLRSKRCNKNLITKLEGTKNRAAWFITNLKGREVSVTDAKFDLGLETLRKRRQSQRILLLMRISFQP